MDNLKNVRVLLADDEQAVRKVIRERLVQNGYDVLTAKDGEEALSLAFNYNPDLIILDIMMPKMQGDAVAEKLREDVRTKNTPIIFLTCLITPQEACERLKIAGENVMLAKPLDSEELLRVIGKMTMRSSL